MTETQLELTAHDPLVARDGRPFGFGQGGRMRGLPWPLPSVVAGSYRTALGKCAKLEFSEANAKRLLAVEVAGAFPAHDGQLYFPAPNDCVVEGEDGNRRIHRARPEKLREGQEGEGCDWPDGAALRPVVIAKSEDFKPKEPPAWWPCDRFADWLTTRDTPEGFDFDRAFLRTATQEMRTHVELDADSGAAAEKRLFATSGLTATHLPRCEAKKEKEKEEEEKEEKEREPFAERFAEVTLAVRVRADGWAEQVHDTWHPLGGERRLVHWETKFTGARGWACPDAVASALAATTRVRMVLATPAIFKHGWRPGWLNDDLTGVPPGGGPALTLVGVSIQRWRAVSGWSMQPHEETKKPGPKAVRRMVPAGGVYFFETQPGGTAALAGRWLESVSDDPQEQRDGFGLATWGTW